MCLPLIERGNMLPSKEELLTMPIAVLENQKIESKEEETLVQSILDQRRAQMPPQQNIYRGDIPFRIETPEKEAEYQKIIDERTAKVRPQLGVVTQDSTPEPIPNSEEEQKVEESPVPVAVEARARFCEFCDSKGVRHKLSCTRPK